jgi:hypothetical protein
MVVLFLDSILLVPPIIFDSYHNQSSHKEIISFCSCHHLPFVNVYVSEFRGDDWVKLILLSFFFRLHFRLFCFKFMTVSMNLNIKLGLGFISFTLEISL